jgi:PAS domain S-box-containing protein
MDTVPQLGLALLEAQGEASGDGVLVVDNAGRIVSHNRRFVEMWGLPEAVVAVRSDEAALRAVEDQLVDPRAFRARVAELYAHPEERSRDELALKDGRTFERHSAPVPGEDGRPFGRVWFFRDITARRRAEEALRQSEERYRSVVDQSADCIFLVEVESRRILECNPALQRLLGYAATELQAMTLYDLVAHSRASVDQQIALILAKCDHPVGERRYRRKDGSLAEVKVRVQLISYAGREVMCVVSREIGERKQAEIALRESESRFRALFERAPVGIAIARGETLLYVNPAYRRMFGYADDTDLRGTSALALIAPRYRDQAAERIHRRADGAQVADAYDATGLRTDGSEFLFAMRVGALQLPDGPATVAFLVDISERKRAEAARQFLAEASRLLAASLDYEATLQSVVGLSVPFLADWCGVHRLRPDGTLRPVASTAVGPALEPVQREVRERFAPGRDPERGLGLALRTGEPQLYPEITDDLLRELARDPRHLALLRRAGIRSGMVAPLVARGQILGTLTFISGRPGRKYDRDDLLLAQDLAGRAALAIDNARLYEESRVAEARYHGLFEGPADALLVAGGDGRFLEVNQAAIDLFGYTREEFPAMAPGTLTGTSPETLRRIGARPVRAGHWRHELEVRRKDGTPIPVEARTNPVELPSGRVFITATRDISERRLLEKMRQEFLTMVGHELKTPITSVLALAQLMQRRGAYHERAVEGIVSQSKRVDRLVSDLVDVSRLETGRLTLRRGRVDLRAIAEATIAQIQPATEIHALVLEAPDHPIEGWWDGDRLEQVFQNLLSNAVKYAPEGGEIRVRIEDGAGGARVSVQDRGLGIPAEVLPKLFDRFYRGEADTASGARGLGLGLYITKSLVEAHGGRVSAVSEGPGLGSTFSFALPYGGDDAYA